MGLVPRHRTRFPADQTPRTIDGDEEVCVRAKPSDADQPLEPLPVYDEGVAFGPVDATRDAALPPLPSARECVDAVRTVLNERAAVRAETPWTPLATPGLPPTGRFRSTFTRMIGVHPAQLADLPNWWRRCARGTHVRVAPHLFLEEPHHGPSGTWRVRGRLRSTWLRRSIPIELDLWPHLDAWTKLSLEPQRRVHAGRRYFKKGHRDLDMLTNRLIGELGHAAT
jgi:hypothetical protein